MNERPTFLPALAVGAVAAILDVATKFWAFGAIPEGSRRPLAGDWLELCARKNPHFAWSIGEGWIHPDLLRFLAFGFSAVATGILVAILRRSDPRDRLKALGLALILGGAAGNLWDRAATLCNPSYGGVRDFILLPNIVFGRPFPAFNLADTWITVGVVFVGWRLLFEKEEGPGGPAGAVKDAAEAGA